MESNLFYSVRGRLYDMYNGLPQIFRSSGLIFSQPLFIDMFFTGYLCEYMIRGATSRLFNLTLALKNVTDSNPPPPTLPTMTAGYRERPSYYSHCSAASQLWVFGGVGLGVWGARIPVFATETFLVFKSILFVWYII